MATTNSTVITTTDKGFYGRLPIHRTSEFVEVSVVDVPKLKGLKIHWSPSQRDHAPVVRVDNRTISLPRYLLGLTDQQEWVKHKNGNYLDCRRENLAVVPKAVPSRKGTAKPKKTPTPAQTRPRIRTIDAETPDLALSRESSVQGFSKAMAAAVDGFGQFMGRAPTPAQPEPESVILEALPLHPQWVYFKTLKLLLNMDDVSRFDLSKDEEIIIVLRSQLVNIYDRKSWRDAISVSVLTEGRAAYEEVLAFVQSYIPQTVPLPATTARIAELEQANAELASRIQDAQVKLLEAEQKTSRIVKRLAAMPYVNLHAILEDDAEVPA